MCVFVNHYSRNFKTIRYINQTKYNIENNISKKYTKIYTSPLVFSFF